MKTVLRHMFAVFSMVAGASMVFGLMYAMNAASSPPEQEAAEAKAHFEVEKTPPKRKPRQKRQRAKRTKSVSKAAPAPQLSTSFAGPSFNLPRFEMADLASAAKDALAADSKDQVFTASSVDQRPQPVQRVAPQVPRSASKQGITGFVKVRFLIDASGTVDRPKVVAANPAGIFEDNVLAAVQQWHYEPARYHGEAVKVSVTQTFRFD